MFGPVIAERRRSGLLEGRPALVAAFVGGTAIMAVGAGWLVTNPGGVRLALVCCSVALILGLIVVLPRYLLYGLAGWLSVLGLVRRVVPSNGRLDPLLLVEPLALAVLVALGARRGAFREGTPLSRAVLVLSALILVGGFNPMQGGLLTGLAGLLFMLVPVLAFWVGRGAFNEPVLLRVFGLVAFLSVGVGAYGLLQTFSHFPSWDVAWIRNSGYGALNVEGAIRAFGTSSSSQEYAVFLAVGIGIWICLRSRLAPFPVAVGALALLVVALFYSSDRSAVVSVVLALGVVAAARSRLPIAAAGIVGVVFLLGLLVFASQVTASGNNSVSLLATHQLQGLGHPFNTRSSTLVGHLDMSGEGLRSMLVHPLGLGTGATTIAVGKFGGQAVGTELDYSNVAVALGLPGLIAYLAVLTTGLTRAYRLATIRRDVLSLTVLGVLMATLFQWLNGGLYSVALLPWLALGWVDRTAGETPEVVGST